MAVDMADQPAPELGLHAAPLLGKLASSWRPTCEAGSLRVTTQACYPCCTLPWIEYT
jgi:hypothetical protein